MIKIIYLTLLLLCELPVILAGTAFLVGGFKEFLLHKNKSYLKDFLIGLIATILPVVVYILILNEIV